MFTSQSIFEQDTELHSPPDVYKKMWVANKSVCQVNVMWWASSLHFICQKLHYVCMVRHKVPQSLNCTEQQCNYGKDKSIQVYEYWFSNCKATEMETMKYSQNIRLKCIYGFGPGATLFFKGFTQTSFSLPPNCNLSFTYCLTFPSIFSFFLLFSPVLMLLRWSLQSLRCAVYNASGRTVDPFLKTERRSFLLSTISDGSAAVCRIKKKVWVLQRDTQKI